MHLFIFIILKNTVSCVYIKEKDTMFSYTNFNHHSFFMCCKIVITVRQERGKL